MDKASLSPSQTYIGGGCCTSRSRGRLALCSTDLRRQPASQLPLHVNRMSTTTQILFNSPALHSLKRDQLVKLCKIHSLKANGKNVDLIQRLKYHADQLPRDAPLSIAARSEDNSDNTSAEEEIQQQQPEEGNNASNDEGESSDMGGWGKTMPRPSEQWVVMDSIEELEESSSQGTLSSMRNLSRNGTGEFGTGSSKCGHFFLFD